MIEIENLTIKSTERIILDGIDLAIRSGERVGIMGESGIGKSTLAFALLGEVGEGLSIAGGCIRYEGETLIGAGNDIHLDRIRALRRVTGHLDQDPASSLNPRHRIRFILTELAASEGEERESQLRETLRLFGLPFSEEFLNRYPRELSGGQRRRVALARILLRNPKVLVLDEPTADLDCGTRDDVLQLLTALMAKTQATVLVISHDFEVIRRLSDRFYILESGRLHPLKSEAQHPDEPADTAEHAFAQRARRAGGSALLRATELSAKAPDARKGTFENLSFCLYEKEALAITGPSGAGKTTLIHTILGIWPRSAGQLAYREQALAPSFKARTAQQRRALGWVPQDPRTSFNPAVPLDSIFRRIEAPAMPIPQALQMVGLSESLLIRRFQDQCSGGQIQRLAIARALLEGAGILLLDEITSSLDPGSRDLICDLLCRLKKLYGMLIVTHDPVVVRRVCDRELRLSAGAAKPKHT